MKSPLISIIVPVYNGGGGFQQCLQAIQDSEFKDWELIVVDDGSTDDSATIAQTYASQVLSTSSRQSGPATARNLGAKTAKGEYLLFLDADCLTHPDTLAKLAWFLRNSPDIDAVFGSYDDAPYAPNFLSQYKNLFHHYVHQIAREEASTFWAGCGAVRRTTFLSVGGFDEHYCKPCIEDIELGYRLKLANHSIRLCKDIQVKHLKRWESISLLKAEIFYRALPWTELILRDRRFDADLNLSHANRFSVMFVFALIGSLVISPLLPWLLLVVVGLVFGLLLLNADVYHFFYRKRGLLFTLRVIPWHWFYFLYGGTAFAYGVLRHALERLNLPIPSMVDCQHSSQSSNNSSLRS